MATPEQPQTSTTATTTAAASAFRGPCILGIDEAGRGPVLGPMVYACGYCPVSAEADAALQAIGVNDSKKLTEEQRDSMFDGLKQSPLFGYILIPLSAEELSNKMLRRTKYNLNMISHDAAAQLIRQALDRGVNVTKVFVDTVGDPGKYRAKLMQQFPGLEITVCPKADSLYPIVSAASICAKVTRDQMLKFWEFKEKGVTFERNFGSGYTSDPYTVAWLKAHCDPVFGYPTLIRFCWSTTKRAIENYGGVAVDWGYDDDAEGGEEEAEASQPNLKQFFAAGSATGKRGPGDADDGSSATAVATPVRPAKRHAHFETRSMLVVTQLF